jgi:hypothetical protein
MTETLLLSRAAVSMVHLASHAAPDAFTAALLILTMLALRVWPTARTDLKGE